MAILNYIPKKTTVLDKRDADGGYYEAVCDNCGRTFYPKSSKAKFCCTDCRNKDYVKRHPAQNKQKIIVPVPKKVIQDVKPTVKSNSVIFTEQLEVFDYLKQHETNEIKGKTGYYLKLLGLLNTKGTIECGKHTVTMTNNGKYEIKSGS